MFKNLSIKFKLLGIVSILVMCIIFGAAYTTILLKDMEHDANIINIAGKQRMLIQKMSKEAFMIALGNLEMKKELIKTAQEFDKNLNDLINGNEERGITPAPPIVKAQLLKVKSMWSEFYKNILIIYEKDPSDPEVKKALEYIKNHNMELLSEMHKAVLLYTEYSHEKVKELNLMLETMIILSIIISVLAFYVVKNHIIKPLEELNRVVLEIAKGNYNIKPKIKFRNDEIGVIFNKIKEIINNLKAEAEKEMKEKQMFDNAIRYMSEILDKVKEGNLNVKIKAKWEDERLNKLANLINSVIESLSEAIKELANEVRLLNEEIEKLKDIGERAKETSEQIADAANQVAVAATD
ncbi:methyl-accepting chemotaxis sensory transducer, partial [Methanocaldococcus villosus KIN24-T80]